MVKRYLIGVDLGTSATKAALYDLDGQLLSEAAVEVPIQYPQPGVVVQDNQDFYASAAEAVRSCIKESGENPKEIGARG